MHHDSLLDQPAGSGPTLSRRLLLGAGGATLAGLAWPGTAGTAGAADTVPTFALDPTVGGTCVSPGCSVCNACLGHAANKLFAAVAQPVQLGLVDHQEYTVGIQRVIAGRGILVQVLHFDGALANALFQQVVGLL